MSRATDVDKMLNAFLEKYPYCVAEPAGTRWFVSNPRKTGRVHKVSIGSQAIGRGLEKYRMLLKSLVPADDAPTTDADDETAAGDDAAEEYAGWHIAALLQLATKEGVTVRWTDGDVLCVDSPTQETDALAQLIRNREDDVRQVIPPTTYTAPDTNPESELMARISETARISYSREDLTRDAERVWRTLHHLATRQGPRPGTNAGIDGLLWEGSLSPIMRSIDPEWDEPYKAEIGRFLDQSQNAKCQSRRSTPPIWWVRAEWNDGGLTITKTTPKPKETPVQPIATVAKPAPTPAAMPPKKTSAPAAADTIDKPAQLDPDDEAFSMLQNLLTRITNLQQRAAEAEARAQEAEQRAADAEANDQLERELRDAQDMIKLQEEEIARLAQELDKAQQELKTVNTELTKAKARMRVVEQLGNILKGDL